MISIQSQIDAYLKDKQEKSLTRERSGKWSPSKFGRCFRMQYWSRKNEPATNLPDERTLRVFECGNVFHDYVKKFLPDTFQEVLVEIDDVKGYADIVDKEAVYDIKSCHSYKFHYMDEPSYDIGTEELPKILQVIYYAKYLNKQKGVLVYVSKDDLCMKEPVFMVEGRWGDILNIELMMLREFWTKGVLPPPEPRAYGGYEGKYCQYLDKCKSLGFNCPCEKPAKTKKEKKK